MGLECYGNHDSHTSIVEAQETLILWKRFTF